MEESRTAHARARDLRSEIFGLRCLFFVSDDKLHTIIIIIIQGKRINISDIPDKRGAITRIRIVCIYTYRVNIGKYSSIEGRTYNINMMARAKRPISIKDDYITADTREYSVV